MLCCRRRDALQGESAIHQATLIDPCPVVGQPQSAAWPSASPVAVRGSFARFGPSDPRWLHVGEVGRASRDRFHRESPQAERRWCIMPYPENTLVRFDSVRKNTYLCSRDRDWTQEGCSWSFSGWSKEIVKDPNNSSDTAFSGVVSCGTSGLVTPRRSRTIGGDASTGLRLDQTGRITETLATPRPRARSKAKALYSSAPVWRVGKTREMLMNDRSLRQIYNWRVPPNWSRRDWRRR